MGTTSSLFVRLQPKLRAARELYQGVFFGPYRQTALREERRQRDLFLLLTLPDLLGLPNPVHFYTLELMPDLIGEYHDWHRRMGMEHAPEGGFRCC
ncbi:MAG: cory-CC-star protein [Longimicrobiaceae bacterium]